jgi:hypothetical protein
MSATLKESVTVFSSISLGPISTLTGIPCKSATLIRYPKLFSESDEISTLPGKTLENPSISFLTFSQYLRISASFLPKMGIITTFVGATFGGSINPLSSP